MTVQHLCPVCKEEMEHDEEYLEGVLCEYHDWCPKDHFLDDYAYGNWIVRVGDKEWGGDYTMERPHQEIKDEVERLKGIR